MALSGSFNTTGYDGQGAPYYMEFAWQATQSIANNTSTVTWTATVRGGSGYNTVSKRHVKVGNYESTRGSDWLDGTQLTVYNGTVISDMGGSAVIQHNADGTGSFTATLEAAFEISFVGLGYKYNSKKTVTFTLDQIPRGAKITSASDLTDTTGSVIAYTNPAGSLTTLSVALSLDGETATTSYRSVSSSESSYTFELTQAEITQLRPLQTGESLTIYYIMKTELGSDTFYDVYEASFHLADTDDNKPVAVIVASPDNDSIPTEYQSSFRNKFIQNVSKAEVVIGAGGKYGATIASYLSLVNGVSFDTSRFTTDVLTSTGTVAITATVTDTRGLKKTVNSSIEVVPYAQPYLSNADVFRCDVNGIAKNNGEYLRITATKNYSPVESSNHAYVQYRTKRADQTWGSQAWTTILAADSASDTYSGVISGTFDKLVAYTVQIRCVDWVGNTFLYEEDIPTEEVNLHLREGGHGVGVGKYVENYDSFEVAYDSDFEGDVNIQGSLGFGSLSSASLSAIASAIKASIINDVYPVGSIYMSTNSTSPATLFGGTWTQIEDTFLLAAGTNYVAGSNGGSDEVTLTQANYRLQNWLASSSSNDSINTAFDAGSTYGMHLTNGNSPEPNNEPFSIMPPYLAVYVWKRTA